MIKIKKQIERELRDFGFIDPSDAVNQLMKLFGVKQEDINVQNFNRMYDVHYDDYIIRLRIEKYQFVLVEIYPFDLSF